VEHDQVTNPTKIGRYEIIDRVGRGGMGAVYRGRDMVLDREVAIKVMSSDFAADESSRPRFYREARAAAKLQHRNIVTIFEFGEEDDTPFIVMEFLRGVDLSKRMRSEPPLTLEQKLDIIAELCTGLHFAHEQGVIHRDVKPANIWLVPDGSVKLLDFGIAKFSSSTMTRQGSVFGSISYMSPEQVNGTDVDGRADIFSAGVVLYELLSGKKPFAGDSPTAVLARIMDDEPVSIAELPADLPRPLVAAVVKALEKDREKRYRHSADFGADLRLVRSAITAGTGPIGSAVDLAETTLTDTGPNRAADSGHHELAGSVMVARTAVLDAPTGGPPAGAGKPWLVPAVVGLVLAVVIGGWMALRGPGAAPATAGGGATAPIAPAAPAAAGKVLVKILSEPTGAHIALNGVETGRITPSEVEVDTGRLPRVTLTRRSSQPVTAQLTSDDVTKRTVLLRLDSAVADRPGPAAPPVAAPETTTHVKITGDYPFEIVENGRVISPSAPSHDVAVKGRPRLYIRNPTYFLNQPVQVDGAKEFEWTAPALGKLLLIARDTCTVTIEGQNLNEPPITATMAAGTHVAEVACDGQTRRETFSISAGETRKVTVK
jgi:predicted Ser/Thr protein kinase